MSVHRIGTFSSRMIAAVAVIALAGFGCGEEIDEIEVGSDVSAETATAIYLSDLERTDGGPGPTSAPTVTPGGIPHGYDGFIIEGAVSISGAATLATEFRYPEFGGQTTSSCAAFVEGISRDWARDETEAIFYEMDRYFLLPSPRDLGYEWEVPNTPEPIGRIWMAVRIMPYDGPGDYDGSSGAFERSTPKEIPSGKPVPAIAFNALPQIEIDGIAYSVLAGDSTIEATISADGSGSLTFSNIRAMDGSTGSGVSGEMHWSCTNARGG